MKFLKKKVIIMFFIVQDMVSEKMSAWMNEKKKRH